MHDARPTHRWFHFSLRRLLVVVLTVAAVALCSFAVVYIKRDMARANAQQQYEDAYWAWFEGSVSARDVCEASLDLFRAQSAMPFEDQQRTALLHMMRIDDIQQRVYVTTGLNLFGGTDATRKARNEVDGYHAEAMAEFAKYSQ